MTYIVLVGC